MACDHICNRLVIFNGISHIPMQKLSQPHKILHIKWFVESKCYCFCLYCSFRNTRSLQHFKRTPRHTHDRIIDHSNTEQYRNRDQDTFDNIFCHMIPHFLHFCITAFVHHRILRIFCPLIIRTCHQMIRFSGNR